MIYENHEKLKNIYEKFRNIGQDSKALDTFVRTMYQERTFFRSLFSSLDRENVAQFVPNYRMDAKTLAVSIATEEDPIMLVTLLTTALHQMFYQLVEMEGNHYLRLDGGQEITGGLPAPVYYIILAADKDKHYILDTLAILYALESIYQKYFYLGMDFEFTLRKIQLVQLNFEHPVDKRSLIVLVNPGELDKPIREDLIDLVFCNQYIKKILHGADSLDVPYIYNELLQEDTDRILHFTLSMIDTKILCEYYKLNRPGKSVEGRCSIYDEDPDKSAVYYFGVVNGEQQNRLSLLLRSMPPVQDIVWNIHRMPRAQILYAQYDVLYLKWFYYAIINRAAQDVSNDAGKKAIMILYKHVLYEFTQFAYLERKNITNLVQKIKVIVDPINNYMVHLEHERSERPVRLVDLFNQKAAGIVTTRIWADLDKIANVNYYKLLVRNILKHLLYALISQNFTIYRTKLSIWDVRLDNQFIFQYLKDYHFEYLLKIFKEVQEILRERVRNL